MALLVLGVLALTGCGKDQKPAATAPAEAAPVAFVAVAPASKPTAPLPEKAECITPACHAAFKTAAHIHGPVSAVSCQSCHAADQGGHHYPLTRQGNALCTFCHAVAGTKAHQHKALEQGAVAPAMEQASAKTQAGSETQTASATQAAAGTQAGSITQASGGCLNCHDPHISKAKFLLVTDNVEQLCNKCHSLPLKKHAHDPFVKGECTACHQPHQSDSAALLRNGDGPEHCFGCHADKKTAMTQDSHIHKPAAESCTTCHGPHATDNAKQLKKPVNETCLACHTKIKDQLATAKHVHGAVTEGNCASCHDPHASNNIDELKARTDKLCLTCHEKAVKTADGRTIQAMGPVLASKNLHGPVKAGQCSECHLPHASDQPNLLKQYFPDSFYAPYDPTLYQLCFSCHNQQMVTQPKTTTLTNFRDGTTNLHFVHVNRADKGRTCKTCHDVHGSDLPNHMAATVPFEGSNWAMPINYEPNADGGSCTPACHDKKTYNRVLPAATKPADRGGV